MKSNQVALCGLSLSLALALYVVVRRSRLSGATAAGDRDGLTYFVKDEALEAARIASEQDFADGSLVTLQSHGTGTSSRTGKVLQFNPQSKSYTVELQDVHGKSQQKTVAAAEVTSVKVKDLYIYPIKSCRGIRLENATITAQGIANDRAWMMVDTKGKFLTQRRYPKMALIAPQLDDIENPTAVTLTAPGMDDLRVPIVREGRGREIETQVWRSPMVGIDQGEAAAAWLNQFLADVRDEREFRLIRKKDSFKRPTNPKFAPNHETVFADAYPFLLALDSSLDQVNETFAEKIPMNRFRPNIVLTGAPAFADEHWSCVTIGGLRFRNAKPCDRCNVPTVDQDKGVAHPNREPQRTMIGFRNGAVLGFQNGTEQSYYFGSNMVVEDLGGLSVGAAVKVLTTKDAVFA